MLDDVGHRLLSSGMSPPRGTEYRYEQRVRFHAAWQRLGRRLGATTRLMGSQALGREVMLPEGE